MRRYVVQDTVTILCNVSVMASSEDEARDMAEEAMEDNIIYGSFTDNIDVLDMDCVAESCSPR